MSRREQKRIRQLERRLTALETELTEIKREASPSIILDCKQAAEPSKKRMLDRLADALKRVPLK